MWTAAGCVRGRFRPDGDGCYRRGRTRHGFFLEYDRGTERSREYLAKLASYYLYRERGGWRHEFQSFPVLLVVSNSERAESRCAEAADRQAARTQEGPLSLLLTTVGRIENAPEGTLGRVRRTRGDTVGRRSYWLAGRPSKGLFSDGRGLTSMPRLDWPELRLAVAVDEPEDGL